jgi:plastocyanin
VKELSIITKISKCLNPFENTFAIFVLVRRIPLLEFRDGICLLAYMKTKTNKRSKQMNRKKIITTSKQAQLMAVAIIAASVVAAAMIVGINNGQNLQKVIAQEAYPSGKNTKETTNEHKIASAASSSTNAAAVAVKAVNPNQSTSKEFWINTVHLDGMTNINAGVKCDTCPQNTPLHPPEKPPVNSTIPTGGGFRIVEPNKVGAWDFRSFTFAPDQIVVNQGDKVTLHFIGVQGAHHVIDVQGIDTFELMRGQIHTVSFVANNPGTITYICHVHLPNMVGQILVLPKAAVV